jgi:hypothetical protein
LQPTRAAEASSRSRQPDERSGICTETTAAHFGFPTDIWSAMFDQGRIDYHPVFPGRAGFGARRIETEVDVDQVIAIMRINYDA